MATRTRQRRWAGWLAVLAALALLAAACGDDDSSTDDPGDDDEGGEVVDDDGNGDGDAEEPAEEEPDGDSDADADGDEPMELSASHRGVTEDTITIGISLLDMAFLAENGFVDAGWGDQEAIWRALVDDLNARGGINGRMVDATVEFYSPIDTADAERVCVVFDEDLEVFAALGGFLGPAAGAMPCLVNNDDIVVIGGEMAQDVLDQSTATWFSDLRAEGRVLEGFVQLLGDNGYFDDSKVAVVSGDEVAADTENVLIPALEEAGVEIVATAVNDVVGTDIPAEDALWEVIAEQIRVAEADAVMINGDTTAAVRGITNAGLDVEMWAADAGQLNSLGDSVNRDVADGALTLQGLTSQETWEDEAMVECRAIIQAANPDMALTAPEELVDGEEEEYLSMGQACRTMALFELLLTAAGADLTPDTVAAAAAEIGEFSLPGVPDGSLGPDKPDALDTARISEWDKDFGDAGGLVPTTELQVLGQ